VNLICSCFSIAETPYADPGLEYIPGAPESAPESVLESVLEGTLESALQSSLESAPVKNESEGKTVT